MKDHLDDNNTLTFGDYGFLLSTTIFEYVTIFVSLIYIVCNVERILYVFFRLILPKPIHPKLGDVLPQPATDIDYPVVAIQLPMFHEIQCCETVISYACNIKWPRNRLIIQVLDDSTDEYTKKTVNACVQTWKKRGIKITTLRRKNRIGFKAGSLIYGMSFLKQAEYVAIFDADFLPSEDYLLRTIPIMIQDQTIAFTQCRWTYTNGKQTLFTRFQEIGLNFHHKCEQECRYRSGLFFGFNGSGGTWRISAITQAGGWHTDNLVEDADLSLRAYLNGWRFVYMYDLECLNELPSSFEAYVKQQHRWKSGSIQIVKKYFTQVCKSRHVSWVEKIFCLWTMLRCFTPLLNIFVLLVLIPINIFMNVKSIFDGISVWLSIFVNIAGIAFTFEEMHLVLLHYVFITTMTLNNAMAVVAGLFSTKSSKEWVITTKTGCHRPSFNNQAGSHGGALSRKKHHNTSSSTDRKQNTNRSYFSLLVPDIRSIRKFFQCMHNKTYRKNTVGRIDSKCVCMGIYLLVFSYIAYKNKAYLQCIHFIAISIMSFIVGFGYIGRKTEPFKDSSK